jgi:hypothetical protein
MANKLTNAVSSINSALFPGPFQANNETLGVFGGESFGFAAGVESSYAKNFYVNRAQPDGITVPKGFKDPIPRSIFNQYALFNYRGLYGGLLGNVADSYFDSQFGTDRGKLTGKDAAKNVSIPKIIEFYDENYPKISYTASDFLYAKYYKKIPVNHLITLRRFPMPVNDNIFDLTATPGTKDPETKAKPEAVDVTQVAGVTAVTYMGESAGNPMEQLLSFSFGLNWKEVNSEMESISTGDQGYTSQPFYNKIGPIGRAAADAFKGIDPGTKFRRELSPDADPLGTTYANFVLGPVNVIDKTTARDRGLKFEQNLKLTFEYELRSLNYVNPKIAMIDIISNMLTMTTNNAQFFGGGQRYYGAAGFVDSQFGDINKLRQGDFSGYIGSVVNDVTTGFKGLFGNASGGFDIASLGQGLLTGGKTLLGNLLGGFLSSEVGAVSGVQASKALISAEPTGNWHVTIGNPLNPILVMGNMYCDNAVMTLGKGLGFDDFPMEAKFEIDVKHGKPRDKGDIENMFNIGRGRIYATAAGEQDILNLQGRDVKVYGAIQNVGNVNLQPTQSDNGNPPSSVENAKNTTTTTKKEAAPGSYISNLVSMMIES